MRPLAAILCAHELWRETRAQDMIEYALIAGVLPDAGGDISSIFSRVTSVMTLANGPTPSG
jgi:Flp pilus assembly pilin Flp